MKACEISGLTVYRGVHGYGEHQEIARQQIHLASSDRPVSITVVQIEDQIRVFMTVLEQMVGEGLVALSEVETIRYTHDFRSAERRSKVR
jgi:uncharacterized protein